MRVISSPWLRGILLALIYMLGLIGIVASGGGGGGDDDVTPPDTNISSGPADPTNSTSAIYVFASTEAGSTFECSLDGGAFANCTSPANYAGLAEGNRSFSVRATDAAGNTDATPAAYNWEIDITPPDTSISSGPADPTSLTDAGFVFASTEAGSTFQCSLDGGAFADCTSPVNYVGLAVGNHSFSAQATDAAGNTDSTPATYNWVIVTPPTDITPPDTSISSGPADPTNSTSASFVFSSTEAGSTFECSINSAAFANCTSPTNYAGLLEGNRSFSARATDAAGNTDLTPATYNWEIDITPPDTNITNGPANPTISTDASFTFTSTEAGSTFECNLDGGGFVSCTSPQTYLSLAEGSHSFSVRATDVADNTDPTPATYDWEIDFTAPDTTSVIINSNEEIAIVANNLSVNLMASDNLGVSSYLITEHNSTDPMNIIPPYLDPLPVDSNWVAVTPTASLDITILYPLSQTYNVGDTVELCAWFMDEVGNVSDRACDAITYGEGWEAGIGNWFADNGVWQVGTPTLVGPASCLTGTQCAGTVLDGNYPNAADSRLTSPILTLPTVTGAEEVRLRFQNWFSYSSSDSGQVQVSVFDPVTSTFGAFVNVGTPVFAVSGGWSVKAVDLTAFAGETVRIAFFHISFDSAISSGWYIDDITIEQITPTFTGDFEAGWADWFADNGVWQVGSATAGPGSCLTGTQCAGTVLDGNYTNTADSRLTSATLTLPTVTGAEEVRLRFQNWFSYSSSDSGQVQVSVFDPVTSTFGAFVNVGTPVSAVSGGWSVKAVDLTAFAGETVRIAFFHISFDSAISSGWYIDDITIEQITPTFTGDFEAGWADWFADNGVWQVGSATAGPGSCLTGTQCAGTVLDGNYTNIADSRLTSATLTLPTVTGAEEIRLRFQNWFSYSSSDSGQVQVSVFDPVTSTFGAFVNVGTPVFAVSGGWSVKAVDLTAFAGETVRIAFFHISFDSAISSGWYIDDITIEQITPTFTGDFEAGWADWFADNGVWQVGSATAGPGSCLTGTQCAGTVLDGNYTNIADSRLTSATLTLPTVTGAEEIRLRFQNWFSYSSSDSGQVQVSVFDPVTSTFGAFVNVGTPVFAVSGGWSVKAVDLTAFAGETVRIAFFHISFDSAISSGWYIDDITIEQITPTFTGDFEAGWADWFADNGVWQVGSATAGPGSCLTGTQCAGTVLDGNYTNIADSRLTSATLTLPTVTGAEEIRLRFQNWFSYSSSDSGQVQVSVFDPVTSTFGAFVNVGTPVFAVSGGWSVKAVDLTAFAGETVRIAFFHISFDSAISSGWYIDDITITVL